MKNQLYPHIMREFIIQTCSRKRMFLARQRKKKKNLTKNMQNIFLIINHFYLTLHFPQQLTNTVILSFLKIISLKKTFIYFFLIFQKISKIKSNPKDRILEELRVSWKSSGNNWHIPQVFDSNNSFRHRPKKK